MGTSGCDQKTEPQPKPPQTPEVSSQSSPEPNKPVSNPALEQELRDAAKEGHVQTVKLLLKQGVNVNAVEEETGLTALMLAAFDGYTQIVQMLLDQGAEVNKTNAIGRTALMFAASGPNIETVRLLLKHGADTNITDNHEAWTALMFAAAEGHDANVKALLAAGADPNLKDTDGESAYDFAINNGHAGAAKLVKIAD